VAAKLWEEFQEYIRTSLMFAIKAMKEESKSAEERYGMIDGAVMDLKKAAEMEREKSSRTILPGL
jgi:hypothetical protein